MISFRRRWPILTLAAGALVYVFNNYTISGLEHLSLRPLERPDAPRVGGPSDGYALGAYGSGTYDSNAAVSGFEPAAWAWQSDSMFQAGDAFAVDAYGQGGGQLPAWKDQLTAGEKLALIEGKAKTRARGMGPATENAAGVTIPVSIPIPVPPGMGARAGAEAVDWSPLALPQVTGQMAALTPVELPGTGTSSAGSIDSLSQMDLAAVAGLNGSTAANQTAATIRIASFKVPTLGPAMLNKPHVVEMIVTILRQYDLVALQGIQTSRDDVLPLIVDKLNQSGRSYDYVIGPRVGRAAPHQQFAFVFDTAKLETDRFQLYTVDDPEDLLNYEPLVAWFRCRQVARQNAFTFSLANVAIDPSYADAERALLPALIAAIEKDGRGEDDWIVAGDISGGVAQLPALDTSATRFAIREIPTDVAGSQALDSVFFSSRATTEFTGRAGTFDFLRKYNLSIERALEVSSHLPVWAEFSCIEGAAPGRLAPTDAHPVF